MSILSKFYTAVPEKELKRRSRSGRSVDVTYYRISKNLSVAKLYLNFATLISLVAVTALININFTPIWATITTAGLAILYLLIIKSMFLKNKLAQLISPLFLTFITKTSPYITNISRITRNYSLTKPENKIYELEDLLELINNQKNTSHNRIDKDKLELAIKALTFSDKTVDKFMTPKGDVRFVGSEETIGTILIDELHQTGQRHFLVYKDKKSNIVGSLDLDDLVAKRMSGKVAWAMNQEVLELQADDSLQKALELFLKSKHQLYVVRDSNQKLVGVLAIDQVLQQMTAGESRN